MECDFSTDQKGSFGSLDLSVVRSSAVLVFHQSCSRLVAFPFDVLG